jgi:hypothetical protein
MTVSTTLSTTLEQPKTILFIGSNPSNSSAINAAFHSPTSSSKILTSWCKDIQGIKAHLNVLNEKTENNRALKQSEIKLNIERLSSDIKIVAPTHIVALGKTAAKALALIGIEHYEMPHPSGRNRQLNDPEYVAKKIQGLVEYCSTYRREA